MSRAACAFPLRRRCVPRPASRPACRARRRCRAARGSGDRSCALNFKGVDTLSSSMMLVELVKNLAAFLLRPLRQRSRKLGIEGDPAVGVAALSRMAPAFIALGVRAEGLRVLELGPGRTPELMVATILAGA